jgi:glutamine synthetase
MTRFFEEGKMFDGSSIAGWKGIEASDMILMPDDSTAVLDPFTEDPTLIIVCDVIEPSTMQGYDRDPRAIAKRAEEYLKSTGIGDTVFVGPEPEFFIFDSVKFKSDISGSMFKIFSEQGSWMSDQDVEGGNKGHRPGYQRWLLPSSAIRPRPRNPYLHVQRHGRNGPGHRSTPPRSGDCRPERNRCEVQHPGCQG